MSKTIRLELNVVAWSLFAIALSLRLFRIDHPCAVVFDELHYGKFVSMYLRGIFFFDSQPPLGKQLVAVAAYFAGYDGASNVTGIGSPYDPAVPVKALRLIPALSGSLLVPILFHIALQLQLSEKTAALACTFHLLETTFLTHSRFLLMDSIQLAFSMAGLLLTLKSRSVDVFSKDWLIALFASSTMLACGLCVKFPAIYSLYLCLGISFYDLWCRLPNPKIRNVHLWLEAVVYLVNFVIWPFLIYLLVFYVHLSHLTKAGPHDNILTSAFQASLEGGLASITRGQPLEVVHGSQVTLRHTHGRTCWLHSHSSVYPVKYSDSRGSSHQQQVTCYSFKDVNNWWIIKKPHHDEIVVHEPLERIRNGDVIQLVHGMTGRLLNSHDVAAPMSPQHQEVSCYIDYNISMPSQNLWKVHLLNPEETGGNWHTIRSIVNLVHLNSSQALKFSGKQLPDWGFNQHEVVTDRVINQEDTVWNVEEHRYTKESDQKDREKDLVQAEFVPLEPTKLNFWEKMKELQYKMLFGSHDLIEGHTYENNSPLDWIVMKSGIAYWIDSRSNSQVHLIGNLMLWVTSLLSVIVSGLIFVLMLMRRRRKLYDVSESQFQHFTNIMIVCGGGFVVNFLPYFFVERSLFLYFYLPCIVYKHLFLASLNQFLETWFNSFTRLKVVITLIQALLLTAFLYNFWTFLPLSYGSGNLSASEIEKLRWRSTWLFIIHKK